MKNLQEATERICELKGSQIAFDALMPALIEALPASTRAELVASFDAQAEAARTTMLYADISDFVLASFERDVARNRALLLGRGKPEVSSSTPAMVDTLLLTTARVTTYAGAHGLIQANGFFYRRGDRLFLVSNRHVFGGAESGRLPDRLEIRVHTDMQDLARYATVSLPLHRDGRAQWREATDHGGGTDVAAMHIPADALPPDVVLQAFDETDLEARDEEVAIGDALTIAGFVPAPGFQDVMELLAVARSASVASSYGVRVQQQGFFLTDAHTHQRCNGSPVVRRRPPGSVTSTKPSWRLLGVHSAGMGVRTREQAHDECQGLNRAWYADVLPALTRDMSAR
jgi:S1-C subfamily serine protease